MRRLLWHWIISAGALWLAASFLSPSVLIPHWYDALWIAPLLGLVNVIVGLVNGIISILALPITILTLGCFGFILSFVLNAVAIFGLFNKPSDAIQYTGPLHQYMTVNGLAAALFLSVIMALFSTVLNMVLPGGKGRRG